MIEWVWKEEVGGTKEHIEGLPERFYRSKEG